MPFIVAGDITTAAKPGPNHQLWSIRTRLDIILFCRRKRSYVPYMSNQREKMAHNLFIFHR